VRRRAATFETESLSASAYLAALGAATDGVLLINRSGVVVYANPAAEMFFSDSGLSGQYFADVSALDRPTLNGIWRELYRERCWRGRLCLSHFRPDLEVTVQRIRAEAECSEQFCVVLHGAANAERAPDQADHGTASDPRGKRLARGTRDARAARAARVARVDGSERGERAEATTLKGVASEIAHDFNNQISVILNYTFVLLRHMPADSPLKQHVSEMQAAAWRASQVAQAIHRALVTHTLLPSGK
jgi:signal transduction histidine kinase